MGIINMIGKLIATLAVGLASARTIIRRRIIRRVAATTHAKKGGIDYYYHGARVRYNKSTMKFKQDKKASIFHTIKGTKKVATRIPKRTKYLVKFGSTLWSRRGFLTTTSLTRPHTSPEPRLYLPSGRSLRLPTRGKDSCLKSLVANNSGDAPRLPSTHSLAELQDSISTLPVLLTVAENLGSLLQSPFDEPMIFKDLLNLPYTKK